MGMKWYVARRLLWAVLVTWIVLTLVFAGLTLSPNPSIQRATVRCAVSGADPAECRQAIKEQRGLNEPVIDRYVNYVLNMYAGDWGFSRLRHQPVWDAIATAWPYSAQFLIPAVILSVLIGYSIGLYSAFHQYTKADHLGSLSAYFGISLPEFWYAIILILFFGVMVKEMSIFGVSLEPLGLPVYYRSRIPEQYGWFSWKNIRQLILPTFVILTTSLAAQMRFCRAQTLEHINAEFVKVAKAKGAGEYRLMLRHVFRVALVPLSTFLIGQFLALLWVGALVVEVIFQIPGIGLLGYKALINQDTSLVMATFLIPTFLAVFGYLVQDLAYVALDPRIDYGDR
jgi:peptide/nickel transport system permease protein